MNEAYVAQTLPLSCDDINPMYFIEELIDATSKMEVYKEKIKDSKIDSNWFLPTLQQKEAIASSAMEGTQATLDGVLTNNINMTSKDKNINEVANYYTAAERGNMYLSLNVFSNDFFFEIHKTLMEGNVRKPEVIGAYRTVQNYIGKTTESKSITFVPPKPEDVPKLMDNLIKYINSPCDSLRPLVRVAIIHAQFETIHPFMDGNGRVGRMLIPMYLYYQKQIELPYFFISEALEQDKARYYSILNEVRTKKNWNEWIKFFLTTVKKQCEKYIHLVTEINNLYDKDLDVACSIAKSSTMKDVIDFLYQHPVVSAKQIRETLSIPPATLTRYLKLLTECKILFPTGNGRSTIYHYSELLYLLRK